MVIFRQKRKRMDSSLRIKLNRKQIYETNLVKLFGIRIDSKLEKPILTILQLN